MKKIIATSAAAALLVVAGVATAQAGVNFSVHVGVPVVAPVSAPVVPVSYPSESPWQAVQPDIYFDEPPRFIYSPNLGFHVSVGIPYDIAYVNNGYYLYRGGYWYLSPSYSGPWSIVSYRRLPPLLHKHRYEQIRHYRDYEYRSYLHHRDRYRGSWHQPRQLHAVSYRDGYRRDRIEHRKERWDRDRWERRDNGKGRGDHWKGRGERWERDGRWDGRRGHERRDR